MNLKSIFSKRSLAGENAKDASSQAELEQPTRPGISAYTFDYMSLPSVNRCVNFLSDKVAILTLRHSSLQSGIYAPTDTNLNYLLGVEPNSRMSAFDAWKSVVANLLLEGEAFILPRKVEGTSVIKELIPLKPGTIMYNDSDEFYQINYPEFKINGRFAESDVIHLVNYSKDGRRGYGFKHWASDVVSTLVKADAKSRSDFDTPDAFIKAKTESVGRLSINEINKVSDKLQQDFGASASVVTAPQYVDYELIPSVKSGTSTVEVKKVAIADIARFFGVPLQYLFSDASSNYRDSEAAVAQAVEAVYPILRRIELEFNRKLVPYDQRGLSKFEFDVTGLYRYSEPNQMANFFQKALQAGMLTPNEIRKIGNKPLVEGGDQLLVSTNLATPQSLVAKSNAAVNQQQ